MIAATASRQYFPALDGLRGIAILLVIVYHNFGFINYTSFGWLGVDLFFVLSGFLITNILVSTVGKPGYLKNFYARRFLRIFPLYYLCLVIFLLVLPRFNLLPDSAYYIEHQAWLWTYLQNWLYIFRGDDSTLSLHHLWSLAVEEQFYVLWPLIILLVRNLRVLLILITLLLVGVLVFRWWIWNYELADFSYYKLFTFTRIDGLCIGSMVALILHINTDWLKKNTPWIVLCFALLNFVFFFINREHAYGFPYLALAGYTTFAMMFGLLVHEVVTGGTLWANRLLAIPPLRWLGKISYALYIFHWPLYLILRPYLENWLRLSAPSLSTPVIISTCCTLAAIALSWASYHLFEKHFLRAKKHFA